MGKIWSINPSLAITHKTDFSSSSISFNAITNHAFYRIEDYVNELTLFIPGTWQVNIPMLPEHLGENRCYKK